MSGRHGPDPVGGKTATADDLRYPDAFFRRVAAFFGFDPEAVEYCCQIPDDKEQLVLWEFWTVESALQIRATWRRRLLPEKASQQQPVAANLGQSYTSHRQDTHDRHHSSDRRGDESAGDERPKGRSSREGG